MSRYDGQVFQSLTRQDGLTGNVVYAIFHDQEGTLWFGASGGVTRYRPPAPSPPPVFVDAVVADRRYEGVAEVEVPSVVRLTAFEFHGMSLKTRPDAMVYRYRLKGYEEEWKNTRERRVECQDLPVGDYTFEVVAVDRDLVYSEKPATVQLTIVRDTRDEQIDELERRVRERTRELQEANSALSSANKELFALNRQLQQTLEEENGQVVFECQDTGAGIPPEIRGEIFKPFFKTKPLAEGTGLGLYICHRIAEKHGGTISVESEVGKGTTFRVRIPVTK